MNMSARKIVLVIGVALFLCCLIFLWYNYEKFSKEPILRSQFLTSSTYEKQDSKIKHHKITTSASHPHQSSTVQYTRPTDISEVVNVTLKSLPSIQPPTQNSLIPTLSKDLVVHSSYFDPRPRNNYNNVTVLFINVNRKILDPGWIQGCGANGIRAKYFKVYSIFENVLMHACCGPNTVVYENQMILCYDLPAPNGSSVFAVYKTSASTQVEMATYSRQPLFHPAPRVLPSGGDEFTILVCSKIHNKNAPWIREFIQYQKTLGVDHIDFSVLDTFIQDNGYEEKVLKDPVIFKALQEGFINFRVWPETYLKAGEVYEHSENLRKLGCIYRYMGTYDYIMPVDTDDFLNPVTGKKKLKELVKDYCRGKSIGSCRFEWVRYFPDCGIKGNVSSDGNVTAHLRILTDSKDRVNYKSIHFAKAILDASFHDARCSGCMVPGYRMVTIPRSVAYIAHNRFGLDDHWYKKICLKQ